MNIKHTLNKSLIAFMLLLLGSAGPLSAAMETDAVIRSERPAVEVVFALDTTSSMGGLIAAAKEKIWSIATTLASADPAPAIKMGLVGYRDRGDQYVTTFTPLSADLDAVYMNLMQFAAVGGGDAPESVNQALYEAVVKPAWSTGNTVYRVIFLVGDAPPQMGYPDDVKYRQSCRLATQKDIIINTIQCGNMGGTEQVWRDIAGHGGGRYFQVAQSGNAVLYDTPYDRKIAGLSRDLDDTRIFYGSSAEREKMASRRATADAIYESAAPAAVAQRTIFNTKSAGSVNFTGSKELVHELETGSVTLADLPRDQLPPELRKLSRIDLEEHVKAQAAKRKELQAEIETLARQRQAFIENKVKEEGKSKDSLDNQIYQCIQAQALGKNIHYDQGPVY